MPEEETFELELNFDEIGDIEDFSPVPDGDYLCILKEIKPKNTANGHQMLKLKFSIYSGEFKGRTFFDNFVFSGNEKILERVKLLCSSLGMQTTGKITLTPSLLLGKKCVVSVFVDEYEDEDDNGKVTLKKSNKVHFAGYKPADNYSEHPEDGREIKNDEVPF